MNDHEDNNRKPISDLDAAFQPSIVAALANLGNTCFANSSLQTIANLKDVVGALRFVGRYGLGNDPTSGCGILPPSHRGRSSNVVRATAQTLAKMQNGEELVVRPIELIRSVQEVNETFASGIGEQHDAAEWLLHGVLDAASDYYVDTTISAKHLSQAFDEINNNNKNNKTGSRCSYGKIWTSHSKMNVWKIMAEVDDENAKEEWEEKKAKNGGIPIAGDFNTWKKNNYCSPYVPRSFLLDSMRGTFLQSTKCETCGYTSRIFSPLTSFELSFPSAKERVAYREEVERMKEATKNATNKQQPPSPQMMSNGNEQNAATKANDANNSNNADCGVSPSSSLFWKILFLPCALFTSIGRAVYRCCMSMFSSPPEEPVTLDELFWAYCRPRGTDMHCSKCKKQTRGTITMKILDLPQVLAIHLKRFEQSSFGGLWSEKIPDYVEFPGSFDPTTNPEDQENNKINNNNVAASSVKLNSHLDHHRQLIFERGSPLSQQKSGNGIVLDLSPFTASTYDVNNDDNNNNNNNNWIVPQVSTFNLNSVINHHGGINSGHYTAFCKKSPIQFQDEKPRWALFNDERAQEVPQENVLQSQAYVLTYEKSALCQESEEMKRLRTIAKEYLVGSRRAASQSGIRVSRLWMFRVASFCDPGPLLHRVDEFSDDSSSKSPTAAYVTVTKEDFETLVDAFGELRLPKL